MIFITGTNGLVGSQIARKFLSAGFKIKALKRENSNLDLVKDIQHQIEWVVGDLLDLGVLEEAMQNVEYVVHCAAMVSFNPKEAKEMHTVNVTGTSNLVNVALHHSIKKFCFVSSVSALGRKKEISAIDEKAEWAESELNSAYAKSKYLAEMEVWRGQAEGMPSVIVNPSVVLGVGDLDKSSTQLFKYVAKEHLFYSKGTLNYVDVRDVAEITFRLTVSDIVEERFILNAGYCSYEDFFLKTSQRLGKKMPKYSLTPFIAEIAWRTSYFMSLLTGKKPFVTKEIARNAQNHFTYSNAKVCLLLNYQFKDLDETLNWVCGEMKK